MNAERPHSQEIDRKLALVERFFRGTGSTYDMMVNAATFGIDRRWKRAIVDEIPANPTRVLDLACGTGILTFAIARRYPQCRVVGVELRDEYLQIARAKAGKRGVDNVEFVLSRAEDYASDAPFDCVVSSYLAKYADLPLLTRKTMAMLKDGGLVLMHDFTYPSKPFLVRLWRIHMTSLKFLGTPLFPVWNEIFDGLPKLIERTRWCHELSDALQENGFRDIRMRSLTLGGSAMIVAVK